MQLVYQDWRTPWFPGMAQEMLARFSEQHPDIHVFYTPDPENVDEQMMADFEAGTAPDVMAGCCDFFATWAQKGYLLDLRPFVASDLDASTVGDWDQAQVRALFTRDGQQYGLPKYHGALALFFNRDMFDRRGVDYPDGTWTMDDYLAAQRLLTARAPEGDAIDVVGSMMDVSWERIQVHVNAWGGHFVDPEDPSKSRMSEPEALAALAWLHDRMWVDRTMATPMDVRNLSTREAFAKGYLAMVEDGSWALKDILETSRFHIGVAPFPAGPSRRVTLATTDGFAIYAGTKFPEAAWQLLKFLVGTDYGLAMARSHLLQPARASLVEDWIGTVRAQYPAATEGLNLLAFVEGHLNGYSVTAEVFANMADARRLANEAWQRILVLGEDTVDSMKAVSERIEAAQKASA